VQSEAGQTLNTKKLCKGLLLEFWQNNMWSVALAADADQMLGGCLSLWNVENEHKHGCCEIL
jgi:hypothetical protein